MAATQCVSPANSCCIDKPELLVRFTLERQPFLRATVLTSSNSATAPTPLPKSTDAERFDEPELSHARYLAYADRQMNGSARVRRPRRPLTIAT